MKPLLLMLTAAALCRGQTTLTRFFRAGESERQDSHCAQVESRASASGARATLHASKRRLGAVVSYSGIRMNGDERVLRAVIAPYITSDMAGRVGGNPFSITPAEYAFEHIAVETRNGQAADVFLVRPRMNNAGRFTGRLWLDQAMGLPVKIHGAGAARSLPHNVRGQPVVSYPSWRYSLLPWLPPWRRRRL